LEAKLLLKRLLLLMIRQTPARFYAKEGVEVAPKSEKRRLRHIDVDLPFPGIVLNFDHMVNDVDRFQEKGIGQVERPERSRTAVRFKLNCFAAQKIARSKVPPISAARKNDARLLNRANSKTAV
jgi:hypothetical protein